MALGCQNIYSPPNPTKRGGPGLITQTQPSSLALFDGMGQDLGN